MGGALPLRARRLGALGALSRHRAFAADAGRRARGGTGVSGSGVTPLRVGSRTAMPYHAKEHEGRHMTLPGLVIRAAGAAILGALIATGALAQTPLRIFDAHLHYNQEPNPFYELDKVLEIFRRNNVTGIIATSRPNKGTHQLVDAKAPGLTVVPFIRPYRTRADIQTWFDDPAIWDLIQSEYQRGYYRGIGEFHIYGKAAAGAQVKRIVDFAIERDLWLHAHCDEEALLILFGYNPKARIIWAHTGFSTPATRVGEL